MFSEALWLSFCGTDATSAVHFYWELFVDLSLVAGSWFLSQVFVRSPSVTTGVDGGVVEFSLLYFSLINGWFLYAHHYASRFREASRLHWLLVWMFILALVNAVTHASFETYRQFSLGMIYVRLSVFLMLSRVACYVDRAQPISALLAVFIGDAILCYALSAASDVESAAILWGFVAITELHVDLFLAVGLRGALQVPYRLDATMDRFYAVILAPMGAVAVNSFCKTATNDESLYAFSSMVLMTLFGMLYFAFKEPVASSMGRRSHFEKASMLILLKILGLFLWTICACLIAEPDIHRHSYLTDLTGWMVGAALIGFLNLRLLAGRRHDSVEAIWIVLSIAPCLLIHFLQDCSPSVFLSICVIFVSILNLLESWYNFGAAERLAEATTTTTGTTATTAAITITDATSGNTTATSTVNISHAATSASTERDPLILLGLNDLYTV
jgi:hypothetical protein